MDYGFFYLINHGVENELIQKALEESRNFFSLPLEEKLKLPRTEHRGYTPLYAEKLDTSLHSEGDLKETFYIGTLDDDKSHLNQWPSQEILPSWRFTMELYYEKVLSAGRRLISLIALALNLEEDFFLKAEPLYPFLRLLHYPAEQGMLDEKVLGASAHSDYGMITLLVSDGVPGLQVCREKSQEPQVWEDVNHISGAFVVNIGDLMERWTNCLYRSTLHRVIRTGQERYSMAFFVDPCPDTLVECLRSCYSEAYPPRFPPIRSGDYLDEKIRLTYKAGPERQATTQLLMMADRNNGVESLKLPVIDLLSSHRLATATSIHQACKDTGFFYLINHGIEIELIQKALEESKNFFSLPLEEKMKLAWKEHRGYTPLCSERLGDVKETIYIGPVEDDKSYLNQWPSRDILPSWRFTMELYYEKVRAAGRMLISLIALALNLEEDFFEKDGPMDPFLRLLHYPGEQGVLDEKVLGSSAHSDYGMMTLLVTDGVPGLQVCREKTKKPQVWEDVPHISGAFVVNIGDMMERWTNCLYRSTLHRVIRTGQERYSMAFFLNPFPDSVVKCLKSCCSEASPPRFPPIRSGDYLKERYRANNIGNTGNDQ
nr:PREDICTED: uncharacterized protein LOC108198342 [Daucus carota subsp. sativus]